MDKEKQAFDFVQKGYELCWKIEELEGSELQTEIITMAEEYTNRAVKDIAALKAEKVGALNAANYWKQNYDTLKAEAEEKQHAIDHMGFDIEQLKAEIERINRYLTIYERDCTPTKNEEE
jgi:hypothetical protein